MGRMGVIYTRIRFMMLGQLKSIIKKNRADVNRLYFLNNNYIVFFKSTHHLFFHSAVRHLHHINTGRKIAQRLAGFHAVNSVNFNNFQ